MRSLTIGQVAKMFNIHVETIRFYVRKGLIIQPPKPPGGIRRYSESTIQQIQFIRHAQSLGFALEDIREMLMLQPDRPDTCLEIQQIAEHKLLLLRKKRQALEEMEVILQGLVMACAQRTGADTGCPILEEVTGSIGKNS